MILAVLFVFLSSLSINPGPTDYYVCPSGSDKANGTAAKPWKTLEYAFDKIQNVEGDVRLIVMDGEYYPSKALALSGIKDRSISIEAAPGAKPLIRGDRVIKRFKPLKDRRILKVSLAGLGIKDLGSACEKATLTDLYWRGERQRIASYPDKGFLISGEAKGSTEVDDITKKEGIFTTRNLNPSL